MEEVAISSRLTTQEKLLVAQAVHKLGAVNWEKISELLENHPVIEGRPKEWFDATTVEAYYVGLMTEIGINVPAQDAAKPRAKVHLRLAQTFYLARLQELKSSIAEYEQTFSKLMSEVTAIKSGSMDKVLKDEVRAVLARKFGKKLLDSWVPDEEALKEAVEAGPPSEEELKEVEKGQEAVDVVEGVSAEADMSVAPADEAKDQSEGPNPVDSTKEDDAVAKETPAEEKEPEVPQGDIGMEEAQATPQVEETASSPAAEADKEDPAMSPASDLSSAPDDKPSTPVKSTRNTGKAGKRKASAQPKGVPQSKRSTRRRTTATPGVVPAEDEVAVVETEEADTAKEEEEEEEPIVVEDETPVEPEPEAEPEPEPESAVEPATPAPIEEEAPKRGRRPNKRESTVRRQSARKATSPEASTRHSSPLNSKRAPSASSARSGTPATEERRSRRAPRGRGMRDEVVSKSVREQSTAGESVREDDEAEEETPKASEAEVEAKAEEEAEEEAVVSEAERPPTRQSRRAKGNAGPATPREKNGTPQESEAEDAEEEETERPPTRSSRRAKDTATPVPERMKEVATERKSTRRSSARGAMTIEDDDKPEVKEEPRDRRTIKRPRESSPKEIKATQKMLTGLLDQIQDQKSGSLFMNPVKAGDAPGYADVIKRPMALKTIRAKIKNQQITTVDEFERDIMLIFANAIMYNNKGTQVHDAALEMIKEAERHIAHFKSVQLHINGQVGGG